MSLDKIDFSNITFTGNSLPEFKFNFTTVSTPFYGGNWGWYNSPMFFGNTMNLSEGIFNWENLYNPEQPQKFDFSKLWEAVSSNNNSTNTSLFSFSWENFKPAAIWNSGTKKSSDTDYAALSRSSALEAAAKDPNLEKLTGGKGWSISESSFINDIPYARKGVSTILTRAAELTGETLVVTSALGTKDSPHAKGTSEASHYNSKNPKLDFGGGLSLSAAEALKKKLDDTGLFSRVDVEKDGDTAHLDVQIASSAFEKIDTLA